MTSRFKILDDQSVVDNTGKIIYFSVDRFKSDIALDNCCFLCGAKPSEKKFNDEHIIPNWILKKYNLHNRNITLPNGEISKYSQYKVPCCEECNGFLGEKIEKPIQEIVSGGIDRIKDYVAENGFLLLFQWLNLLFLKTHLKDREYRYFVDRRDPDYKISEIYDWEGLHHIHCIARSPYTKCQIDSKVFCSILILPTKSFNAQEQFDYGDNFPGKGLLVRFDDFCIISILNDSCASVNLFENEIRSIEGFLNPLQYREILVRLSYINVNLKIRPKYFTDFNYNKACKIVAQLPDYFEFEDKEIYNYGDFLYSATHDFIDNIKNPNKADILKNVKNGTYTFLFDENGNFINN